MRELRKLIRETLDEITNTGFDAFHGSETEIKKFTDSFVGGDSPGQEGPGIYFATSYDNARMFGKNVYKVRLDGKFLEETQPASNVDAEELLRFIQLNPDWEMNAYDYSENAEAGAMMAIDYAINSSENEVEVWQNVGVNFYRYNEINFVRAMTKMGYDGIIVAAPRDWGDNKHIIVYNPGIIEYKGIAEESESESLEEGNVEEGHIDDWQDKIESISQKLGYSIDKAIGEGTWGAAYRLMDGKVLKVTMDSEEIETDRKSVV